MLWLIVACTQDPAPVESQPVDPGRAIVDTDLPEPFYELSLSLQGPAVRDPVLGPGAFELSLEASWEVDLQVAVVTDEGVVTTLHDGAFTKTVSWDLTDDKGETVVPGSYTMRATQTVDGKQVAQAEQDVFVVRVGLLEGRLTGEDRLPLTWHKAGGPGMYWDGGTTDATFVLDAIDDGKGSPTAVPPLWEDLYAPPSKGTPATMPAAYPYDAQPLLELSLGGETVDAPISAHIEGWTLAKGPVGAGQTLSFAMDVPLSDTVGVVEPTLLLEYTDEQGLTFASQELPLRIYALYGPDTFPEEGAEHQAWVAAIDPALRAIEVKDPDPAALLSALVDHIYYDMGLAYDTQYGASAYNNYQGWSFEEPHFQMTAFLDRAFGSIVNCSDCAGILNAYANMLGIDLHYAHIYSGFQLNFIQAIGYEDFTDCPFGPNSCGFSYHAVTTLDDTMTIYDATLALDGDKDPTTSPHEQLMVHEIPGKEYLFRLVESGTNYYDDVVKGTIQ